MLLLSFSLFLPSSPLTFFTTSRMHHLLPPSSHPLPPSHYASPSIPLPLALPLQHPFHPIPLSYSSTQLKLSNFVAPPSSMTRLLVEARLGGGRGAGVLERPGLDQSQSSPEPSVEEGGEMGKLRQSLRSGGGDRYRVLLLDHERHTEAQVAAVLPKVVPSITPDEARRCFRDSREKGAGLVIVTVKEHAEFYAQMMARCGLRSSIEPDTVTI